MNVYVRILDYGPGVPKLSSRSQVDSILLKVDDRDERTHIVQALVPTSRVDAETHLAGIIAHLQKRRNLDEGRHDRHLATFHIGVRVSPDLEANFGRELWEQRKIFESGWVLRGMRLVGKKSFEGEVFAGADCFQGCDQEIIDGDCEERSS